MGAAHLADHAKAAGMEAVLHGGGRTADGCVHGRATLAPRALLFDRGQHSVQRGCTRCPAVALLALGTADRLLTLSTPLTNALAVGLLACIAVSNSHMRVQIVLVRSLTCYFPSGVSVGERHLLLVALSVTLLAAGLCGGRIGKGAGGGGSRVQSERLHGLRGQGRTALRAHLNIAA